MKNIKNIIKEEINKFIINESVTDVVYHFTSLGILKKILATNTFYMPTWLKGNADKYDERRKFYISLTRQRNKKMGYSRTKNVRIELDGEKLNQNFKGKAINYWGGSMGKNSYYSSSQAHGTGNIIPYVQSNTENEDRIFSYTPKIDNFNKYIRRVDILIEKEGDDAMAKQILNLRPKVYVYIYDNINDFNYQTKNTINDEISLNDIKKTINYNFDIYGIQNIGEIVNFILNGKGLKNDNLSNKKLKEIIAKLLKKYNLEEYISSVINYCNKNFYNFDFKYTNIQSDIDSLHHNVRDMSIYDKVMRMLVDFLDENGFKDLNDVKKNSFKKWAIKNNYFLNNYDNFDWSKKIKFLIFAPSYESSKYIIPEPNKECFWDLFPTAKEYILSDEFFSNINSHKSKNDEYFKKYIQHLTHINISVSKMIEIINKFDTYDFIKYNIINGEFAYKDIKYGDLSIWYNFFNNKDKITVKKMFLDEKYK